MAKEKYHVSLKAIIVRPDRKVLGLNGKLGGLYEGFYDIPGGRIETDEFRTLLPQIIRREIKEETGLSNVELEERPISLGRHLTKDGVHVLYVFFLAHVAENIETVQISGEHEGFVWLDVNEANLEKYFVSGILEGMRGYLANK